MPQITSHSKTSFAVYQGDKVKLNIVAPGEVSVRWIRSNEVLCRMLFCEIETTQWSLGSHKLVAVVYNKHGSRTVSFAIRLLAPPQGYVVGSVTPPQVDSMTGEENANDNESLVVYALEGRGFAYDSNNVHVIGATPRILNGREKLKSQPASWLRFGRFAYDEHFLTPRSSVQLVNVDNARRIIVLRSGRLRSRVISREEPRFSIAIEDGLQIDTDSMGDVIVERLIERKSTPNIAIHVLRGNARVVNIDKAGEVILVQGSTLRLTQKEIADWNPTSLRFHPLPHRSISFFARSTTPHLFREYFDDYQKKEFASILQKKPVKLDKQKIRDSLDANDPIAALELAIPFVAKEDKDGELRYLIAMAYFDLAMHRNAFVNFKQALSLKYRNPGAHYFIGRIYLQQQKWNLARINFEKAENEDFANTQDLHYYSGVASYRLDRFAEAKRHFSLAVWNGQDEEIIRSAKQYLKDLNNRGWLSAFANLGLFYDGNVLRTNSVHDFGYTENEPKSTSTGLISGAGFRLYGYRDFGGEVSLGLFIDRKDFFESSLRKLYFIAQGIDLNMVVNLENSIFQESIISAGLRPFLILQGFGGQRSLDTFGYELHVASPRFNRVRLAYQNTTAIDPLPGREDVIDPVLREAVAANDRTHKGMLLSLGGDLFSFSTINIAAQISIQNIEYEHAYTKAESFRTTKFKLPIDFFLSQRSMFANHLSYETRSFSQSTDARLDKVTTLGVNWKYAWTPALLQWSAIEYEMQKSSRDGYSLSRPFIVSGLRFDL